LQDLFQKLYIGGLVINDENPKGIVAHRGPFLARKKDAEAKANRLNIQEHWLGHGAEIRLGSPSYRRTPFPALADEAKLGGGKLSMALTGYPPPLRFLYPVTCLDKEFSLVL
jgi:hypothetical protein